jgi:hypothetical protein
MTMLFGWGVIESGELVGEWSEMTWEVGQGGELMGSAIRLQWRG